MEALNTFHRFSDLPPELREAIWILCLPSRIHELSWVIKENVTWNTDNPGDDERWSCTLRHTSHMNRCPPLISRICHESRRLVFKFGSFAASMESLLAKTERPAESEWFLEDPFARWICPSRDIIHNSWTSADTAWCGYDREVDAHTLDHVAWKASLFKHGASIMVKQLDDEYFSPYRVSFWEDDELGPYGLPPIVPATLPLTPGKQRDLEALRKIHSWKVVMQVVVVHANIGTVGTTGLFGLLNDAPIQLVDIVDEARVATYMSLARTCERRRIALLPQDFTIEPVEKIKLALRGVIITEFGSDELVERMQPVIMFRLCTKDCNHGLDQAG